MGVKELEAKVRELESQVKSLQTLWDIEQIKKLQKAYGYYLINWLHEELIDCFAKRPDTLLEWPEGIFKGTDGPKRFFSQINKKKDPEFMHQMMQLSGIVDMEPDGERAKGRWWGFGAMAIPAGSMIDQTGGGVNQAIACGVYEIEYIKEGGTWKILKLKWVPVFNGPVGEGWVSPERRAKKKERTVLGTVAFPASWKADGPPPSVNYEYPSGRVLPFHYKHPVTGKKTTEEKRNRAAVKK